MQETKKTKVRLLSWTQHIVETIYCEWQISRTDGPVPSPAEIARTIASERAGRYFGNHPELSAVAEGEGLDGPGAFESEVRKVFEDCVAMKVPIAETVNFVFEVEHMPIAMREQWVRHRIGHKFNFDFGFETLPNQHDSSWWSQTFRAKDMGSFATEGEFLEPEWLDLNGNKVMGDHGKVYCQKCGCEASFKTGPGGGRYQCDVCDADYFSIAPQLTVRHFWQEQHRWIQGAYRRLAAAGMPLEDVRNILPLGVQHRMTWSCNLAGLTHLLSKRGCWIAQLGMWEPVVRGLVAELTEKVDPYFQRLVDPPCIGADDKFHECKFHKENDEYIKGTDPHHPCPLWLYNHGDRAAQVAMRSRPEGGGPTWEYDREPPDDPSANQELEGKDGVWWAPARPHVTGSVEAEWQDFQARSQRYAALWGRNPLTGERVKLS